MTEHSKFPGICVYNDTWASSKVNGCEGGHYRTVLSFPGSILDVALWAHSKILSPDGVPLTRFFGAPRELCCTMIRGHAQNVMLVKEAPIAFLEFSWGYLGQCCLMLFGHTESIVVVKGGHYRIF